MYKIPAVVTASLLLLTGCDDVSRVVDLDTQIIKDTNQQLNNDKQNLDKMLDELKKIDPDIVGVNYNLDSKGKRVLEIHKKMHDHTISTFVVDEDILNKNEKGNNDAPKAESSGGGGFGSSFAGSFLGMYVASQLMNNSYSHRSSQTENERRRAIANSTYSTYVGNQTRRSSIIRNNTATAKGTTVSKPTTATIGRSSGGSFGAGTGGKSFSSISGG